MRGGRVGKITIGKISVKTSLLFILFGLVLCLALGIFSYRASYESYSNTYSLKAQETAAFAASLIDGDRVMGYLETLETDEHYENLEALFSGLKADMKLLYLYAYVPSPELNSFRYVLDAMIEGDDPDLISVLGEPYDFDDWDYQHMVPNLILQRASTEILIPADTMYGTGVLAMAPFFTSDGKFVGMVEAIVPFEQVEQTVREYATRLILISSSIVVLMVGILAVFIRRVVTRPLSELTESARNFVRGDTLYYESDIQTGDEMQELSEAMNEMSKNIEDYTHRLAGTAADRERMSIELSVAKDIQASLLPKPMPGRDDFIIRGMIEPSSEAGGHLYDFFLIDQNRLCMVIADVLSSGVPAALFAVMTKTMIKNQMMTDLPVEQSMTLLNTRLHESTAGMSVAAFVGVLDVTTGVLTYVNARQSSPLLMRGGGRFEFLQDQVVSSLAENENVTYRRMEVTMRQGDRLLLLTEGAENVKSTEGEVFGTERLHNLLNVSRVRQLPPEEMLGQIRSEILDFSDRARHEDLTMLLLEYTKGDKLRAEIAVPSRADSSSIVLPFIKRQLNENGLGGAFYAVTAVAVEELLVLASSRAGGVGAMVVRCSVSGQRVEIRLFYGGQLSDPRDTTDARELDALGFIERNMAELGYEVSDGKNILTIVGTSYMSVIENEEESEEQV